MNTPSTILIVDDEPDIRTLYKTALEKDGFNVLTAVNGKEAVEVAKEKHPDLVLLDETMPVVDGYSAQQKLKKDAETAHIPVVFLTAFSNPASRARDDEAFAKESGVAGFIKKGVGLDELVKSVRQYLPLQD